MSTYVGDPTQPFANGAVLPDDGVKLQAQHVNVPFEGIFNSLAILRLGGAGFEATPVTPSGGGPYTVAFNGALGNTLHITTTGAADIEIVFSNLRAGGRYAILIDHLHTGSVDLTWAGTLVHHRWRESVAVDGQPRPGSARSIWRGTAYAGVGDESGNIVIRWVADSGNVGPGTLRHVAAENSGARVAASGSFDLIASGTFSGAVVTSGTLIPIWQTPAAPYVVDDAVIELTGNCSASVNQTDVVFKAMVNSYELVSGITSWGTSMAYTVGGANASLLALPGELLEDAFTPDGKGNGEIGAVVSNGRLKVLRDGGADGLWDQTVYLRIEPSANATMTIPWRVRIIGRLLVAS